MAKEKLSERKRVILQALVDSYITSAEPISSASIKSNYLQDVSSATIRNELATLEDMGYLVQPHISAGRIPSSKAYRFYVDCLLSENSREEVLGNIRQDFEEKFVGIEEIVRSTAKIISDKTNYTSIVVLRDVKDITIKEIKLVDLADGTALLVIITDNGNIRDKIITLMAGFGEGYVQTAAKILNDIFTGKKVGEVTNFNSLIGEQLDEFRGIFEEVFLVMEGFAKGEGEKIFLEGTNKIFDYPEYDNVGNIKQFLTILNEKEKLKFLASGGDGDIEFTVRIGKDDSDDLQNMAIVTAKYSIGGKEVGHAGVIGPERMDYKKVLGVLGEIRKTLEIIGDDNKLDGGKRNGRRK